MKALRVIALSFSYTLLFTLAVNAQSIPALAGSLQLTLSTNNPLPGQSVTISAQSYDIDINSANVTWSANGKTTQQGIGLTTLQVQAPALGKKVLVSVTATTPAGRAVSGTITIQ